MLILALIIPVRIYEGTRGNGLEIAERLDIAIDVAHAITYLHMYTGMHFIVILKYLDGRTYILAKSTC